MLIIKSREVRRAAPQAQGNSGISGSGGQARLLQIIYRSQIHTKEVWGSLLLFFLVSLI